MDSVSKEGVFKMMASKVVEKIQELIKKYGDKEMWLCDMPVENVEHQKDDESDFEWFSLD